MERSRISSERKNKVILFRSRGIDPAVQKIASSLGEAGYDVHLIVWDRNSDIRVKSALLPYSIHTVNLPAPYDSVLSPLAWPIWWAIECIYLIRNDYSLIHACDFDTVIPAFIFSKIRRVPLFYTIYDYYSANMPNNLKLFKKLISQMENFFISRSDCLFVVDENRLEQIKGCNIKDMAIINNSPMDISRMHRVEERKFTIFYAGALLKSRGIEHLIELPKRLPDINLEIAGTGPEEHKIVAAMKDYKNIHFLGQISYKKVIEHSQKADVLVALYDPSIENNQFASPNKLFEAMMLSKPIVVSDNPSLSKYIADEKCGIVVRFGNTDDLTDAILKLKNSRQLCQSLGNNGRYAYEQKYSWNIMKERILSKYYVYVK